MKTFRLIKSELLKELSCKWNLFKCHIEIDDVKLEGIYISSKIIKRATVMAIAYSDVTAYLVFYGEGCVFDKTLLQNQGYQVYMKINWDHLLYRPNTFLQRNTFVHYSAKKLDKIFPVSLNVGNKYSSIASSSFWIIPTNYYPSSVYGDKTDECNIVYNFYRRLSKEIFANSDAFLIWPYKNIKIFILDVFYYKNRERIDGMLLYAYSFNQYGFFASIGGEYCVKEYTFDNIIEADNYSEIRLSDYKNYIELINKEQFSIKNNKIANAFKEKHFCDIINSMKPEVYYSYDEVVDRRKEVKDIVLLKGYYYKKRLDYDFDGINIYKKLFITADLHIGKNANSYKAVLEAIEDFWRRNTHVSGYLLLLGDIIDADYLTREEKLSVHKYFVQVAKCNVFLILGNNDLLSKEDYLACGYKKVWYYLVYGNIIFSHMPISCDFVLMNIHAHLHGRNNYINIIPYNHIDVGYKACNNKVLLLQDCLLIPNNQEGKTYEFLDINKLFDKNTIDLYDKYKSHYYISDCIVDV